MWLLLRFTLCGKLHSLASELRLGMALHFPHFVSDVDGPHLSSFRMVRPVMLSLHHLQAVYKSLCDCPAVANIDVDVRWQ